MEAVVLWFPKRMLRISWTDKVTNEEVLHKVNIDRNMLNDIVRYWSIRVMVTSSLALKFPAINNLTLVVSDLIMNTTIPVKVRMRTDFIIKQTFNIYYSTVHHL